MSSQDQTPRRGLTEGELFILSEIQHVYGRHNSEEGVFFGDDDEAVLFVTDSHGDAALAAVLTNLANLYADGTMGSMEELRTQWLAPV